MCFSDALSAAVIFHTFHSRPVGVNESPGIVREPVVSQGKGEVSEFSRELILYGDAWDTQKHLYICLSIRLPGRICQQLNWRIHNVLVFPAQFFVLVVQALALEAIFGGLCLVFLQRVGRQPSPFFTLYKYLEPSSPLKWLYIGCSAHGMHRGGSHGSKDDSHVVDPVKPVRVGLGSRSPQNRSIYFVVVVIVVVVVVRFVVLFVARTALVFVIVFAVVVAVVALVLSSSLSSRLKEKRYLTEIFRPFSGCLRFSLVSEHPSKSLTAPQGQTCSEDVKGCPSAKWTHRPTER